MACEKKRLTYQAWHLKSLTTTCAVLIITREDIEYHLVSDFTLAPTPDLVDFFLCAVDVLTVLLSTVS